MTIENHLPVSLKFYSMSIYGFSQNTKVSFHSNKGHEVSIALLPEEYEAIIRITDDARSRALKEIPEMIAEVIAEERVAQILAKREMDMLEVKQPSTEQEVPF